MAIVAGAGPRSEVYYETKIRQPCIGWRTLLGLERRYSVSNMRDGVIPCAMKRRILFLARDLRSEQR